MLCFFFFFSSRRRHTRCALATGVQTCALPISALATSAYDARRLARRVGSGASFSVASTISASVPSLPTSRWVRLYPVASLVVLLPTRMTSPLPVTATSPRTLSRVQPYFTASGPPALPAGLPPTGHWSGRARHG